MKKMIFIITISIFAISCLNVIKEDASLKLQDYTLTLYKNKFDTKTNTFLEDDSVFTVQSDNDTTAYLLALNTLYNEKVKQRGLYNYGQPKSFLIVDKNKIDISLKLSKRMIEGLQLQVKSTPQIKKMLNDYNKDSLTVL